MTKREKKRPCEKEKANRENSKLDPILKTPTFFRGKDEKRAKNPKGGLLLKSFKKKVEKKNCGWGSENATATQSAEERSYRRWTTESPIVQGSLVSEERRSIGEEKKKS